MGQQQLTLLVLGVVVVGIAAVAGLQAFGEGRAKAHKDAAVSDAVRIVSRVQAWKLRPPAFGGGGAGTGAQNFNGLTLKALGYPVSANSDSYTTLYGCYKLDGTSTGATLSVYADSTSGTCAIQTQLATVTITGAGPEHITWNYN